jgi:hypothetical protein
MSSSIGTEHRRLALRSALALVSALVARPAFADSPTREGTAQALFEEGTALFARADYDQACEKFRASDELDPKGGTELNLALCREKQGRTASAWTAFSEARNRSLKEGRSERVAFADKKIAELKPVLPHLRVTITDEPRALEIKVDGQVLPHAAWNTSVPIDPGDHRIEASAPDRRPVTLTVRAARAEETTAALPALVSIPKAVVVAPPVEQAERDLPRSRWLGWTALGAGVAAVGVGSVFGLAAFSNRSDAESLCAASRCAEGRQANDDGIRNGWIANAGIGVGLIAIGAGVWLLVRDRAPAKSALAAYSLRPSP